MRPLPARLRAELEVARAQAAAGLTVAAAEVDAWIDSWGTPDELPMPRPRPDRGGSAQDLPAGPA